MMGQGLLGETAMVDDRNRAVAGLEPFDVGAGLDEVLVLVAEASAMNFTYSKEVEAELAQTRVELEGVKRMRRGDLEEFLVDLLAAHGFELLDVGPASLRVWQVAMESGAADDGSNPL